MSLNKGDNVLCVNDSIDRDKSAEILKDFQNWVEKGRKYVIREVLHNDGIVVGLLLEDVWNMPLFIKLINRCQEPAFGTFRFRKLKKDSSEFFEEEADEDTMQLVEEILHGMKDDGFLQIGK